MLSRRRLRNTTRTGALYSLCPPDIDASVTIAFFSLAGLELLGALDPKPDERVHWIEWLWSLQSRVLSR